MPWPSEAALDHLVTRFRAATLPKSEWTHAAHLATGSWHVHHLGALQALAELRTGIRRLNDFHGTPNTDRSGYHETITRAYGVLLEAYLAAAPEASLTLKVQSLLAGPLAGRDVLFTFYSREVLLSVPARRDWVEPDLQALGWPARGGSSPPGNRASTEP